MPSNQELYVTDDAIKKYLGAYLAALESTATEFLEPDVKQRLLHLSLLPAKITCYISTLFGVAFEYEPSDATSFEVKRGSGRVEDLLFSVPKKLRAIGPMLSISGRDCGVSKLTLSGGFPFRLTTPDSSLSIGEVRFELGGYRKDIFYAEVFGNRSAAAWTEAVAIGRAKDMVLLAMVGVSLARNRGISLGEWIDDRKEKTVLLLGNYNCDGSTRLDSIAECLRNSGYEPIMLKDIPDHPHQNLSQKVVTFGSASRFVVIDDSCPSGHIAEFEKCKQNDWVTILLHGDGQRSTSMTAATETYSKVIREFDFDVSNPQAAVDEATHWAENVLDELKRALRGSYPWRAGS